MYRMNDLKLNFPELKNSKKLIATLAVIKIATVFIRNKSKYSKYSED